jgi:RsiW-degrading membrane proteinase PrsW (M82 family)
MNIDPTKTDWHYLVGTEVRGPVSLQQLDVLIAAGSVPATVMIASKESANWRPASEVRRELAATSMPAGLPPLPSGLPPLPADGTNAGEPSARWILDKITDKLNEFTETEKLEGFSLGEMFSETFQKRTATEMEEYFIVGTEHTTPKTADVQTGWPKPWMFLRLLLFFAVVYGGFVLTYKQFPDNPNLVPGLILMGAFAMPITTLVLFFELNTPRNVSLYRMVVLVALGGIVSLAISLIGYDIGHLNWLGASSAGIIEELGKLAALVLIVRGPRYRYILNGLLLGAAVGAGFAAFESAGYAFRALLSGGAADMESSIFLRAVLTPLGHIPWTAMVGAALWRVKGANPLTLAMFLNPKFYRVLLLAMALHMLWDCPFDPPFYLKELVLGAVGWFVVRALVQQGLRQVRDEQRAAEATVTASGLKA